MVGKMDYRVFMDKETGEVFKIPVWDKKRIKEIESSGRFKELVNLFTRW